MKTHTIALLVAVMYSVTVAHVHATTANYSLSRAFITFQIKARSFSDNLYYHYMNLNLLKEHNIYAIPVGAYFKKEDEACFLVYSPLANLFYLSLPNETAQLEEALNNNKRNLLLERLLDQTAFKRSNDEVSIDTFCTLHLLLNEKCNFHCKYCYSAEGRSSAELSIEQVRTTLDYFLSAERKAVKERTVMFMGGGEPVLSWSLLEQATEYAQRVADVQGINIHFSLTTNGSIMNEKMLAFLKKHDFTVQLSFEILPDVQSEQRGNYEIVANNLLRLTKEGINNYVRSTITATNVDRIPEMVEYCHDHFPGVTKMSCQQVVDPAYFISKEIVDDFFNRYFISYQKGVKKAKEFGITLRSSSSHLLNYSKRERFCYNLLCLTPYGTLTTCPDVSSPNEKDYNDALIGEIQENNIRFDKDAFSRVSHGNIYTIEKCKDCFARWNCGSGCPSSRRVYSPEIFDAICNYYRKMLCNSLMEKLSRKYEKATGKVFYVEIAAKL